MSCGEFDVLCENITQTDVYSRSIGDAFISMAFACAAGGILGLEREYRMHLHRRCRRVHKTATNRRVTNRTAGLRTHILVALGACVFSLESQYGFRVGLPLEASSAGDPGRIAAQIVSGACVLSACTLNYGHVEHPRMSFRQRGSPKPGSLSLSCRGNPVVNACVYVCVRAARARVCACVSACVYLCVHASPPPSFCTYSGVGFLGGGAILKSEDRLNGLTTAASIWLSAALGMMAASANNFTVEGTPLLIALCVVVILQGVGAFESYTHFVCNRDADKTFSIALVLFFADDPGDDDHNNDNGGVGGGGGGGGGDDNLASASGTGNNTANSSRNNSARSSRAASNDDKGSVHMDSSSSAAAAAAGERRNATAAAAAAAAAASYAAAAAADAVAAGEIVAKHELVIPPKPNALANNNDTRPQDVAVEMGPMVSSSTAATAAAGAQRNTAAAGKLPYSPPVSVGGHFSGGSPVPHARVLDEQGA